MLDIIDKLHSTTIQSHTLTNSRLKYLSSKAQITEDHISRIGLALSLSEGLINFDWEPELLDSEESNIEFLSKEKQIRGKTLFKEDLPIWMALILKNQVPEDYSQWRIICRLHWERGVQLLMEKSLLTGDWLRTLESCL
jgi:hypothetical protein